MNFIKVSCVAVSAALAFASCSNDDVPSTSQLTKQVQIRILNDVLTKAAQNPGEGSQVAIFGDKIQVQGLKGTSPTSGLNVITLTAGAGTASIPGSSDGVQVFANWDNEEIDGVVRTDKVYTRQGEANSGAVGLKGTGVVEGTADAATASVDLSPEMSRFEVSGKFTPVDGTAKPDHALKDYNIVGIYLNNVKESRTSDNPTNNSGGWDVAYGVGGPWNTLSEVSDSDLNAGPGVGKVFGFNLFPQVAEAGANLNKKSPHLIFKLSDGTTTKWLNVRNFLVSNSPVLNFEAGKIFQVDLNDISAIIDQDETGTIVTPTPDPDEKSVSLTVTVTKWTAQQVKPGV